MYIDQTVEEVKRRIEGQYRRDFTERNIRMKKLKVFSVILLVTSIGDCGISRIYADDTG